jgi:hypothetical protein
MPMTNNEELFWHDLLVKKMGLNENEHKVLHAGNTLDGTGGCRSMYLQCYEHLISRGIYSWNHENTVSIDWNSRSWKTYFWSLFDPPLAQKPL